MNDFKVNIPGGVYVIAVSGGVDSMVLLDMLAQRTDLKLIVAHFDHGIRPDSSEDLLLVKKTAHSYNLPFVSSKAKLGPGASEAEARKARYEFLRAAKSASGARAIITAHHQDDVIETAIHNILRGTKRKGLSSLKSSAEIIRPLVGISKLDLYVYAKSNGLVWREDQTNKDLKYKRNYIRHKIVPKFSSEHRQKFVELLNLSAGLNQTIDSTIDEYLNEHIKDNKLNRHYFIILPHQVAMEVMAAWLRRSGIRGFDTKLLNKLTIKAKTLAPMQRVDINFANFLEIDKNFLALMSREC